jgi:hypothetical protein
MCTVSKAQFNDHVVELAGIGKVPLRVVAFEQPEANIT